jgi:glycosyltransferase involved in cell wall biosynthesis
MNILLIGSYSIDRQESMLKFVSVLAERLNALGQTMEVVSPKPLFGRLLPASGGLGKWLGYLDKFLLFPLHLWCVARAAGEGTVFHICDHSNAMYGRFLTGRNWMLTCHDLLAVRSARGEFPWNRTGWTGRILQGWISHGIVSAPAVACVSEATLCDVLCLFPSCVGRVRVVENGLNFPFRRMEPGEARLALERLFGGSVAPRAFLLHVGAEVWYKNRGFVLELFARLLETDPRRDLHLVMVGPQTRTLLERAEKLGLKNRCRFLHDVEGRDLNALYSSAEALIFPSLAEGFGWPVIEAFASGCRVATSNRPPMANFAEGIGELFDPCDKKQAAEVVRGLLDEPPEAKARRIEAGLRKSRGFSTDRMVEGYLEMYRTLNA